MNSPKKAKRSKVGLTKPGSTPATVNSCDNGLPEYGGYPFAMALTGLKLGTLYCLVSLKRIPHIRHGRRLVLFSRTDLAAWINSHKISPSHFYDFKDGKSPAKSPGKRSGKR